MDHIQEFLIKYCHDFLKQDSVKMLHVVTRHEAFSELKKVSLETICENPDLLFGSDKFFSLEEDVLTMILKCGNLNMDEGIIWDRLIKWGIAQHPKFKSDVTKFTNEDFETLKKTLHELLQFVRFHQIDKEQFITKVWPFRRLLPDNLIEDILRCHLVPSAAPLYIFLIRNWSTIYSIDSVLMNKEIAKLFIKWIDKKSGDNKKRSKNNRYEFNLLFQRSRDGLTSQAFHQKCDNKGATIIVGKVSNSNRLVGGYNPLDWNGNGQYKDTTDSFIFSLDNLNDPQQSSKIGRVNHNHSTNAIYCHNGYGPTFGGGHDLYAPNNNNYWQFNTNSYANINVSGSVSISDYEAFQIVKKN
ncbi:hypothetical protein C2G38_2034233 [Gigaspora rosea]|uniref:TLDc domain-containing protein n=1 Tax=Gigaspora rosea TaxID=44941 RepID=A0A397VKT6_9GLOM|nr:hypothetical protein C2G38_2034233 [Gigaspora rosea]